MSRLVTSGLVAAVAAIALWSTADRVLAQSPAANQTPAVKSDRWGAGYIPNVELITQDGKPVQFYDDIVKGRIVVISFVYTTCLDICPLITARLAQAYDQLGEAAGRDIHFVSISIDPEKDTPAKLKEHADAFRSDPRWVFLTGTRANIDLVRHRLGERSRKLTEHRAEIVLRNDRTGEWTRSSAFADLGQLVHTIRTLNPAWDPKPGDVAGVQSKRRGDPIAELPGQGMFIKACAACHTIGGGDRLGPDLKGLTDRRSRDWAADFIRHPRAVRARKDAQAMALVARFPSVRMPNLGVSEADAKDLLSYIEARSFAVVAEMRDPEHFKTHTHGAHDGHGTTGGTHNSGHDPHASHGAPHHSGHGQHGAHTSKAGKPAAHKHH